MLRSKKSFLSNAAILIFVITIGTLLSAEVYPQELLTTLDRRSLKGKIDPGNNSPLVVEITEAGFDFSGRPLSLSQLFNRLDDELDKRTPDNRIIFVTTDAMTPVSRIVELLRIGRKLGEDDFSLAARPIASTFDSTSAVPVKIVLDEPEKTRPKPGPRFLGVELASDGSLTLNGKVLTEPALVDSLKRVFDTRKKRRIYMAESRDVEKTVFVRATLSNKFGDLLRVIKAVKSSGGDPIAVEIDWLS